MNYYLLDIGKIFLSLLAISCMTYICVKSIELKMEKLDKIIFCAFVFLVSIFGIINTYQLLRFQFKMFMNNFNFSYNLSQSHCKQKTKGYLKK